MRPSLVIAGLLSTNVAALKIAASLQWIEHTPLPYAITNFYNGSSTATLESGGVQNIQLDSTLDLAANAETQGLLSLASDPNIRLIYVVCDVAYRIVANKASGISTLSDLKGKKIGTIPGTSAAYFIDKFLSTVNLTSSDYRVVAGNVCMKAPCGAGTFPTMIQNGVIDAFGVWEPAVELAAEALGDNAVLFENASIYQEVYSLYTTTTKLADPDTKSDIVAYVQALNQTLDVFTNQPDTVYSYVAQSVGMDVDTLKAVWPQHKWAGIWGDDLLDFLVQEEAWVAAQNRRQPMATTDIQAFLDPSIWESL